MDPKTGQEIFWSPKIEAKDCPKGKDCGQGIARWAHEAPKRPGRKVKEAPIGFKRALRMSQKNQKSVKKKSRGAFCM